MKRTTLAVLFWVGLGILTAGAGARASTAITEPEAHAIGVDAYLYFYSLVTMDLTREQLSNVEPGKGFGGPMNTIANVPAYPTAADNAAVCAQNGSSDW